MAIRMFVPRVMRNSRKLITSMVNVMIIALLATMNSPKIRLARFAIVLVQLVIKILIIAHLAGKGNSYTTIPVMTAVP